MEPLTVNPDITTRLLQDRAVIYNKRSKTAYSLGEDEYRVLVLIDGHRTIQDIHALCGTYTYEELCQLVGMFQKLDFLGAPQNRRKRGFNPFMIKKALFYPERASANRVSSAYAFFVKYLTVPLFLLGMLLAFPLPAPSRPLSAYASLGVAIAGMMLSATLHELAHAAVAVKAGAALAEFGIGLMCFIFPCFYTRIIGVDRVPRKAERIQIYAAGPLLNLGLAGIGLLAARLVPAALYGYFIVFSNLNLILVLFNLNYAFQTDTYRILSEAMEDRMFRKHAFQFLASRFKRRESESETISRGRKLVYFLYAVSSAAVFVSVIVSQAALLMNLFKMLIVVGT